MTSYDRDFGEPLSVEAATQALNYAATRNAPLAGPLVSPSVAALHAYPPARPWRLVAEDLGIPESDVLLLAANENVLGPSPKAVQACMHAMQEAHRYPDGSCTLLRSKLSKKHSVDPGRIVIGNGSNEIIELLVRTFVQPGETVVTAWPSFVVYRLVAQAHGRDTILAPLRRERYDLNAMAALIDHHTKIVFIANPNNPTGTYVTKRELQTFLERIPSSVIVVIDEAYFEYTSAADFPNALLDLPNRPRLVVLRTFSKIYGLAGLRVGYGIMDPELVEYIERVRQPYNVNMMAQKAAAAALDDVEHVENSRKLVQAGQAQLRPAFEELGLKAVPSQANFMVIKLPFAGEIAQKALRQNAILVRAMGGYGMSNSIRINIGTEAMNERVLSCLAQVLKEQGA